MQERIYKGCEPVFEAIQFENLKEMLKHTKEVYSENIAFKFFEEGQDLKTMTYKDYIEEIEALGTALIDLGLKDKRIGVIGENRYEWEASYLAITTGVGIVVPLDKSLPENEILSLIERSEMEAIIYSSKYIDVMNKAKKDKIGKIKNYICMDEDDAANYIYKTLIEKGKELIASGNTEYFDKEINSDEMAIMLYTSGTTSQSKAVMLSNRNICTNVYDISLMFNVNKDDTLLSFLPLHHVFECTVGFLYPVSVGANIGFCRGIRHIADDLKNYQASVMISVPILFENMYKKVMKSIEKQGKLETVKVAMKVASFANKFHVDIRKKLFKEIHANLGGKLRLFVAGAAAFEPEVEKGFNALGIDTFQGYGLTECSPVVAAEHYTCTKLGSIGKTFPSIETKIIDPDEMGIGELAVKGPTVMLGYLGTEENPFTEDGWFLTGDLAYIDADGYIFITGRKKSVIVLKNGKNIYPEEVEALINKIPGIKESFVYGKPENGDEIDLKLCAELVYDKDLMKEEYGVETTDEIKEILWNKVKEVNKSMPTYKYVKEIIITEEELIKTTTLKIKRFEEIKKVMK